MSPSVLPAPADPWALVAADRRALADLVAGLDDAQLATPSLCGAWTVREVVAHLLVGPTVTPWEFVTAMVRSRGRFDDANLRFVENRRHLDRDGLVAGLREHAGSRFHPPGFDWHAPLSDLRIHALDIVVPLGLDAPLDPEPWAHVLEFVLSPKAQRGFVPRGRPPLAVRATDAPVAGGPDDAPAVTGPAAALAGVLCGRAALLPQVEGPGVAALSGWLGDGAALDCRRTTQQGADRFRLGTLVPGEAGRGASDIS